MESLRWNHSCGHFVVESVLRDLCRGIRVVETLLWNRCCGSFVAEVCYGIFVECVFEDRGTVVVKDLL